MNTVTSTSAGRLFDAVSALLGIKKASTFEGEASMYLEFAAGEWIPARDEEELREFPMETAEDGRLLLPTLPLFRHLLELRLRGVPIQKLAYLFHERLAEQIRQCCRILRDREGLSTVALSGGVFQNLLLTRLAREKLEVDGFHLLLHSLIPPNDGGICLGQALAAMYHINHMTEKKENAVCV